MARKSKAKSSKRAARGLRASKPKRDKGTVVAPAISFSGEAVMSGRRRLLTIAPGLESLVAGSAELTKATEALSERVTVTVAPKTQSAERLQDQRGRLADRKIDDFRPRPDAMVMAAERLKQLGFEIQREGRFTITAAGPARLINEALNVQLTLQARPQRVRFRATQNFAASYAQPHADDLFVAPMGIVDSEINGEFRISTISSSFLRPVFLPPAPP